MTNKSTSAETLRKNRNNDGRPKLPILEKKSYKITIKFATAEYYSLKAKTRQAGVTISEFIRLAIQSCSVKERLNPSHVKHISQLSGMANNLNQIARRMKMAKITNKENVNIEFEISKAILSILYNRGKITKEELDIIGQKNKISFCV